MTHTPPTTLEEFNALAMTNSSVSGFGIDNLTQHFPCPFCAAPEWLSIRIIELSPPSSPGTQRTPPTVCSECSRSAQFVATRTPDGSVSGEIVQVDGPDPPDWLIPAPRRETPTNG